MQGDAEHDFVRFQCHGDLGALGRVVDRLGPDLLATAMHLASGPAEAEDLLQETLLVAMERADRWDPERPLRPWLAGILANRARLARQRGARHPDPERLAPRTPRGPCEQAVELELTEELEAALREVPGAYQSVLVLRLEHHLPVSEIAEALRRPPGTVRSQLQRGLEHLRRRLPASYAGAFLPLLDPPSRGLAAVKAAVLSEAARATGLGSAPLAGVLAMKPALSIALVAVVAVIAITHTLLTGERELDRPRPRPVAEDSAPARAALAPPPTVGQRERFLVPEAAAPGEADTSTRAAPAPTPDAGSLLVQVREERTGEPAAGYLVQVESFAERSAFPDPLTAITDARGEALFDALPAGPANARLLRGSEGAGTIVAGETARLTLEAWSGVTVRGQVVDGDGRPVPTARPWVSERWRTSVGYTVGSVDAQGRFTLASLTSDQVLGAVAPGYAPSLLQPVRGEAGARYEVVITLDRRGGAVLGAVVDRGGAPVAGALVMVGPRETTRRARLADGGSAFGPPLRRVHTDERGAFRVAELECGPTPLLVRARGFAPHDQEVSVHDGPALPLSIVLAPEAVVVGRVTDGAGDPYPGARVHTHPAGAHEGSQTFADPTGAFELRGLGAGPVRLVARHADAGEASVERFLVGGAEHRWDPVLAPSARFEGVVLDHEGAPLEGWTVVAQPEGQQEVRRRSTPTDPAGRFVIPEVEGVAHRLWVQEPKGWQRFPRLVVRDRWPGAEHVLRLQDPARASGTIVGEVVAPHGEAPEAARLALWHEDLRLWREYPVGSDRGAIRIEGVPPGSCSLELRSRRHPWLRLGSHTVTAGGALDLGRVTLCEGGELVGDLLGASEEALETLRFLLVDDHGEESGTVQRSGRAFRSNALAPGAYALEVRGERVVALRERFAVRAGHETALTLRLAPAPLRRVVVECAEPRPSRVWCEVRDGVGERVWMDGNLGRGEDGRFVARISLPAGRYRLAVGAGAGRTSEVALVLGDAGGLPPLRITL